MDYTGLLTYETPTGEAFVWSGTLPNPQCTLGSTRVGCPHKTTREEAERLVQDLCKQYPNSVFCLKGKCPTPLRSGPTTPKMGMVVSPEGHGVGVVTTSGDVRSLPAPIPHPLPSIAHESGTVPIVQAVQPSDAGQLAAQVTTGKAVGALPPQVPPPPAPAALPMQVAVPVKPIKETSKKQDTDLLAAIQKGVALQAAGKSQRCDVGFYWSQKLGRCVAVAGTADQQVQIVTALQQKFAGALPPSSASVSTVSSGS